MRPTPTRMALTASILLTTATALSACDGGLSLGGGAVPSELEGTWRAAGDHGDGHSWYKAITLEGDRYSMEGYPPITETAVVSGAEELGPRRWKLTLTDHVFHGSPADDQDVVVELAADGRSVDIDGQSYQRSSTE